ncbi:MAG: DUF456 domain-containing protein [Pirellulales bacterium]
MLIATLSLFIASLVTLIALASLVATFLGLPGNWVIVVTAVLAYAILPQEWIAFVPAWSLLFLSVVGLVGEGIEFGASALGVGKLGGSKRSAALAIVGSLVGAIAGMFVGLPVPVVGSLIASVLCAGVGACVGAVLGERWKGKDWDGSVQVGVAAFWGKLAGTLGKSFCGAVMAAVLIVLAWTY